jgi:hypothetical protein
MGVKVEGAEQLMFLLKQGGSKAMKGALDQMRVEAKEMAELAREMAPVDEGDLEKAIKVRETGGGRGSSGQFRRKELVIEVDGDMPAGTNKEGQTVTVGDYAYEIHEHMAPAGTRYNLGPKSRAKQASQRTVVGGKYLERALVEKEKGLVNRVVEAVTDALDDTFDD